MLGPVSNMRRLTWSNELQNIAQAWTDQCIARHDNDRRILDGGEVSTSDSLEIDANAFLS